MSQPVIPGGAVSAVQNVAARKGAPLPEHVAEAIVAAAWAYADGTINVQQVLHRPAWDNPDGRGHLRLHMRRELLYKSADEGYVPVGLPVEDLSYRRGFPPGEPVPEHADWDEITVRLTVDVRRPWVDRRAAVKAGIL
jgi:hypothetical protein